MPTRTSTARQYPHVTFLVDACRHQRSHQDYMRSLKLRRVLMNPDYQTRHMSHLQQASISRSILGIRLSSMQRQTRVRAGLITTVLTVMLVLISSASVLYALTKATILNMSPSHVPHGFVSSIVTCPQALFGGDTYLEDNDSPSGTFLLSKSECLGLRLHALSTTITIT
jgi:hypothetical protein